MRKTGSPRSITPPAAKLFSPFKAIVYISLAGGVDSFKILTPGPSNCPLYNEYIKARGLDGVVAPLIYQHLLRTPRVNKNDKTTKLVDSTTLNCDVLDEDLAPETFTFIIHFMVMITSAVLLVELVNFIWIGCPHVPAALDVKHHIVRLALYLDQSRLCELKKEAAVFHLWCYLIQKFDVSIQLITILKHLQSNSCISAQNLLFMLYWLPFSGSRQSLPNNDSREETFSGKFRGDVYQGPARFQKKALSLATSIFSSFFIPYCASTNSGQCEVVMKNV